MSAHHRTAAWAATTRRMRPLINATLPAPCVDCGRAVMLGDRYDVGHILAQSLGGSDDQFNLGPSHISCNRKDGGRLGGLKSAKKRNRKTEIPKW